MNGTTPTTFSPMTTTSRAMIVTMLWRMEGSPVVNYRMDFTDVKEDATMPRRSAGRHPRGLWTAMRTEPSARTRR